MGSQFVICCNFVSKLLAYLYTAVSLDWVIMGLLYDFSSTIEPPCRTRANALYEVTGAC